MTLDELKAHCMAQTNNDAEDVRDFLPFLDHYLNEGYDILVGVWEPGKHIAEAGAYPILTDDNDAPQIPYWAHRYIADYATWLLYRNGNPQKQSRGERFRLSFEEGKNRLAADGGKAGAALMAAGGSLKYIINVYPDKHQRYAPEPAPAGFDPLA